MIPRDSYHTRATSLTKSFLCMQGVSGLPVPTKEAVGLLLVETLKGFADAVFLDVKNQFEQGFRANGINATSFKVDAKNEEKIWLEISRTLEEYPATDKPVNVPIKKIIRPVFTVKKAPKKANTIRPDIKAIAEYYLGGKTVLECAEKFNTSDTTIRTYLKSADVQLRDKPRGKRTRK